MMTRPARRMNAVQFSPWQIATASMLALSASAVLADDVDPAGPPAPAPAPGMADVLQRLQQLEEDNTMLRQEVDELRSATDDEWLTEQRADQIRGIVQDVLADADTRASLMQGGLTAGWSDGFFLGDPNGRFLLRINGTLQTRWVMNVADTFNDEYLYGFELPHTRLWFSGFLFRPELDLEYMIRGRFQREGGGGTGSGAIDRGGSFNLQDAWVGIPFTNTTKLRVGQFKLPFTREELVEPEYQLAVERSAVNESMNIGRSQGVELIHQTRPTRLRVALSDGGDDELLNTGSIVATSPANTPWSVRASEFAVTGRFEYLFAGNWKQFDDFTSPQGEEFGLMFGVAGHWQLDEYGGGNEVDWFAVTADISAEWGGANAFISFAQHYTDTNGPLGIISQYGLVAQAGIYVTPKWEIYGRYEWGGVDGDTFTTPQLSLVTGGYNYYIDGQDVKWTSDIGVALSQISGGWASNIAGLRADQFGAEYGQVIVRTQLQLSF